MKFISVLITCLFLASCASTTESLIVTKLEVVIPPPSLLNCPEVKLPEKFNSNKDVARSYLKLWRQDRSCHNNMVAIRKYLNEAQKTTQPPTP